MKYKGKEIIRMVGKLSGRAGGGFVFFEYANHTVERIALEIRIERGRRVILWHEAKEGKIARFPSIDKEEAWRAAS